MIEVLVNLITAGIQAMGYFGIFLLMAFESMILPVPSEAVMPFAGYLVSQGAFSFWLAVIVATLGSVCGSLISYAIGFYGGKPFVEKAGKYVFLNRHRLEWTHKYFERRGSVTIFIARFIPIVRHLISIPAGVAGMDLKRFVVFTAIGAAVWNTFLLYVGTLLAKDWQLIGKYSRVLDILVLVLIVLYFLFHFKESLTGMSKEKGKKKNSR